HHRERADAEPQEEFLRWQGSQRGAVLLAVLHLLATRLDGPVHAWELRRWLGRGEELDIGGLVVRVGAHLAELAETTRPDDTDLVLLTGIWQTLVGRDRRGCPVRPARHRHRRRSRAVAAGRATGRRARG